VPLSTFNDWRSRFPEFEEACNLARMLRQRHFERLLLEAAAKGGDSTRFSALKFALATGSEDFREPAAGVNVSVSLASLVIDSMKLKPSAPVVAIEGEAIDRAGPESAQGETVAASSGAECRLPSRIDPFSVVF
jgi:hypothetical protein